MSLGFTLCSIFVLLLFCALSSYKSSPLPVLPFFSTDLISVMGAYFTLLLGGGSHGLVIRIC